METQPVALSGRPDLPDSRRGADTTSLRRVWHGIRTRILGGLLLVSPILITLWVIHWLYTALEKYVIDPFALLILWKFRGGESGRELPFWFETYAAPVIGFFFALFLLY